jgi:hypothetical protein
MKRDVYWLNYFFHYTTDINSFFLLWTLYRYKHLILSERHKFSPKLLNLVSLLLFYLKRKYKSCF